ncbi:hypothetical protein KFL_002520080 [Klebsormidium nitens]|uniref:DDE-1 domain-containing protein n=1 Tax=Klebsormidium nitens TaxID=105231 RepID=A0A1Y1I8L4_KLENI|nr:hypothetical protein KFL_002520080 [Klebsormidium nitens]|eukprot:GAQ85749.1 hypothetical protein KFL_002520080 [Klebsormidium nitens]
MDETGWQPGNVGGGRVLAQKGVKTVQTAISENRENTTFVGCIAADGTYLEPVYIFKGKRSLTADWLREGGAHPNAKMAVQENGYMTAELFPQFLQHYIDTVPAKKELNRLLAVAPDRRLTKADAVRVLEVAKKAAFTVDNIKAAFRATALDAKLDAIEAAQRKAGWEEEEAVAGEPLMPTSGLSAVIAGVLAEADLAEGAADELTEIGEPQEAALGLAPERMVGSRAPEEETGSNEACSETGESEGIRAGEGEQPPGVGQSKELLTSSRETAGERGAVGPAPRDGRVMGASVAASNEDLLDDLSAVKRWSRLEKRPKVEEPPRGGVKTYF